MGGALIPFLLAWLFQRLGRLADSFLLIAVLGLLWCGAFWPWFRDGPKRCRRLIERAESHRGRTSQDSRGGHPGARGEKMCRIDERLVRCA